MEDEKLTKFLNRAEFYAIDCNWCDYTTSELFNVVANLCMEEIEESAINSSSVPPKIWKRYVDDSFCIIKKDNVPAFHDTLNSIDANISFTIEIESDNKISFLDTLVTRRNGTIAVDVYRKPTHTDRYLDHILTMIINTRPAQQQLFYTEP